MWGSDTYAWDRVRRLCRAAKNQRVKLAYYLSMEKPRPTVFIFDEPTTGLHFHDINTLMDSFSRLIKAGHTVIIIEHNMDVIKTADHVIDI